jgi:DNA-binding response OmpR family regulator
MTVQILFVEQDESPVNSFSQRLLEKGYAVTVVNSAKEASSQLRAGKHDVLILDSAPPDPDGREIYQALYKRMRGVSVILITDGDREIDETMQVDFHLCRPFTIRKLVNRIKKLEERRLKEILRMGDLTLDARKRIVTKGDREYRLTPKQAKLLEIFVRSAGEVLSRKTLMKEVWHTDYLGDTRTLDVHVRWLREKIEDDPSSPIYLRTVRGVGYRFEVPAEKPAGEG